MARRRLPAEASGGEHVGEIAFLGRFLSKHFGALEADFQRFYGIDLRQAFFGSQRIGVRRFLTLMRGLPADSAFAGIYLANTPADEPSGPPSEPVGMSTPGARRFFGAGAVRYRPKTQEIDLA